MSLEERLTAHAVALEANTATLKALLDVLRSNPVPPSEVSPPTEQDPPKSKRLKKEASAPSPEPGATAASETAAAATATRAPTYDETAAAVKEVLKANGADAVRSLLASFNAKNLREIPEAKFGEVIAAAAAITGEA